MVEHRVLVDLADLADVGTGIGGPLISFGVEHQLMALLRYLHEAKVGLVGQNRSLLHLIRTALLANDIRKLER